MTIYTLIASFLTVAIALSYLNACFLKMPMAIAMMSAALVFSLLFIILGKVPSLNPIEQHLLTILQGINFHTLLMKGMLSFLLFAGGLSIDLEYLLQKKWEIGLLASISTIASTFLIGTGIFFIFYGIGLPLPWLYAFLFGALISPTDPIAVLALFKSLKAPANLRVLLEGESLFNDGVGIVLFITLYQMLMQGSTPSFGETIFLFLREAIGGLLYGYVLAKIIILLMKSLEDFTMHILLTFLIVTGGYSLADTLGISGPLAMVVAGICIARYIKNTPHAQTIHQFWEIIDELFNAVLFFLIGMELIVLPINWSLWWLGLLIIPFVLGIRFLTVAIPLATLHRHKKSYWSLVSLLTWGGLRGGLAIALALSLPNSNPYRAYLIGLCYAVVCFSILIQGMTVKPLIQYVIKKQQT